MMGLHSRHIVFILFLICTGTSTLRAKKWVREFFNRNSKSDTCTPVVIGSADYFTQKMSQQYSVDIKDTIYTNKLGPRNTTTAQVFFSNREFSGKEAFMSAREQDIGDGCMNFPSCDPQARYRTYDGSCNNLEFPPWGAAGTAFVQLIPQHFDDGIQKVRKSQSGAELPSSRLVHTTVCPSYAEDASPPLSPIVTYFFVIWGQMMSHDVSRSMEDSHKNGPQCTCCSSSHGHLAKEKLPSNCMPISVPANDTFYSKHKVTCLSMMRTMTTDDKNCSISPVRSITGHNGFLDLSMVYGISDEKARTLRTMSNGKLRMEIGPLGDAYPPNLPPSEHHCPDSKRCADTGDVRANQNGHPFVIHTIFLLFHNYCAKQLLGVNSHWDDERIFQESRKISIAMWQFNTYSCFLPILIGHQLASDMNMTDNSAMVMDQYDKFLNPSTFKEFTSCAFRAFHTMVPSTIEYFPSNVKAVTVLSVKSEVLRQLSNIESFTFSPFPVNVLAEICTIIYTYLYNEDRKVIKKYKLRDHYFNLKYFDLHRFVEFLLGLITQPAQILNEGYSPEIGNFLFIGRGGHGLSLPAIDIQRGQDHGLVSYPKMLLALGGPHLKNYTDMEQFMDKAKVDLLRKVYANVDDIAPLMGMMMEKKYKGSMGGFTFSRIIQHQMNRWKNGDRCYYTFKNNPGHFTDRQLQEIKKLTMANVMCLVTKVKTIQPNVFKLPSKDNKIQNCDFDQPDFTLWAEPKS